MYYLIDPQNSFSIEISYSNVNDFLLHKVLETKKGNQSSNGILYLIICELLDIPVKAIGIPKQFVLAYFKPGYSSDNLEDHVSKIEFFIEPASGQVFSHKDIEKYFKRISVPPTHSYFKPYSNKRINQPVELILGGMEGPVYIIDSASRLLPLAFTSEELR